MNRVALVALTVNVGALMVGVRLVRSAGEPLPTAQFTPARASTVEPLAVDQTPARDQADRQRGTERRTPWTTSRISGSPEPPLPYRTEQVFPKLRFKNPVVITAAPGTDRLFVVEQSGKLFSIPDDPACEAADLFFDLPQEIRTLDPAGPAKTTGDVYGLTFHPRFQQNRYCYICYVINGKDPAEPLPDGTRVSRFRVTETDPPRVDPASEEMIITWLAGGHNGGCLAFGPDGMLYISTGDATPPNPPDGLDAGQDMTRLLSGILRIDVDRPAGDRLYSVPKDNPFVSLESARPEKWAYGFRNPWKISFDRVTGDLWAGDVGWESWELVYRIERGGNYGWSIMEGPQQVRPEARRGPTPILPPTIALPHSEAASVTGGYVYRGTKLPELTGAYIFGDWETRRMWAAWWDGTTISRRDELVEPTLRIVAFGEDNDGELYILDYDDGTIHQLVPNALSDQRHEFPRKLSETGLFESVREHRPAPGVIPFSINAEQWSDHATSQRLLGLAGDSSIRVHPRPVPVIGTIMQTRLEFPQDAVLAKTISIELERGKSETARRMETQILHYTGKAWRAYSYEWNDDQTDATLVHADGKDRRLTIIDHDAPGGRRTMTYYFAARTTCLRCHNPWAQHTLALNLPQLDREQAYGAYSDNQVRWLERFGFLIAVAAEPPSETDSLRSGAEPVERPVPLVNPYDISAGLNERARSYLHSNCAHCHQPGGGGTAEIDLRHEMPVEQTKTLGIRPAHGTFGIHDAHILSPGDPYRSVLFYRISKLGGGRMPHIGSEVIDQQGLDLIHDWIRQLPVRTHETALVDRLCNLEEVAALERERRESAMELERLAKEIAAAAKHDAVSDEDRQAAAIRAATEAATRAADRVKARGETIAQLLGSTSSALVLSRAIEKNRLPEVIRDQVLAAATTHADPQVRDLFVKYLPDDRRPQNLGSVVRPADILKLSGDAARGRQLFHNTPPVACKNCHRIGESGSTLGPELTQIGTKYTKSQILESILEPSKFIEPKYLTYLVETKSGRVYTGLLVEKTTEAITLRDAQDQPLRIPITELEQFVPQRQSLMPELLLRDMTAEQVADLLEYLATLK